MTTETATAAAAAGRDDIAELAALLNEIRVTWRPLGWPARDRMRGMVLHELFRFRAQQEAGMPLSADCPWDVSGLVDASREQLLSALRRALFNEAQLGEQLARTRSGADAQQRDIKTALARCAGLLDHRRKTVPMDALKGALYPEITEWQSQATGRADMEGST